MRSDHESIERPLVREILEDRRGHGDDLRGAWSVTQCGRARRLASR